MKRGSWASAIGAASVLIAGVMAPAAAQSLDAALATAWRNNPTILAERARQEATSELKAQARAGLLPRVTGAVSYDRVDSELQPVNPALGLPTDLKLDTVVREAAAEQTLFDGLRNVNTLRGARAEVRAGAARLSAVEQDVLSEVAAAYFAVAHDLVVFNANRNNVDVLLARNNEAKARLDAGMATRTDVAQAEARLAAARAQLASAQAALALSRARYVELVGEAPGDLSLVQALPPLPETAEEAAARARLNSPLVAAAREEETARERAVAVAKGQFSPTVSASARYRLTDEPSTFFARDETFSYGARLTVPIFLGGLNISRVREARALHESAEHRVQAAERAAEAAARAAFVRLIAARVAATAAREEIRATSVALEGVRVEASIGARTTLDVLNAVQESLNAEVSLAAAQREEGTAAFELLAATGELTME